jgi:monoamine oxidase
VNVGIVGAGLAGLACADGLQVPASAPRLRRQRARAAALVAARAVLTSAERGGELIDNLHKTMLGYARRFDLAIEDVSKGPGEVFYYFAGQRWPESVVVDEFREFAAAMRVDFRRLSNTVTAAEHTDIDSLDRTSLLAYLEGQNGPVWPPAGHQEAVSDCTSPMGLAPTTRAASTFCSRPADRDRSSARRVQRRTLACSTAAIARRGLTSTRHGEPACTSSACAAPAGAIERFKAGARSSGRMMRPSSPFLHGAARRGAGREPGAHPQQRHAVPRWDTDNAKMMLDSLAGRGLP